MTCSCVAHHTRLGTAGARAGTQSFLYWGTRLSWFLCVSYSMCSFWIESRRVISDPLPPHLPPLCARACLELPATTEGQAGSRRAEVARIQMVGLKLASPTPKAGPWENSLIILCRPCLVCSMGTLVRVVRLTAPSHRMSNT